MKVLIFGAGVIGSVFGMLLSNSGVQVDLYARGRRLHELKEKGLLYYKDGQVERAHVNIVEAPLSAEQYDFAFVTVKYEQVETALEEVKLVNCRNIVTMVNNPLGYEGWESIVGEGRIIPAFPGAGGKISHGVLDYAITPRFIQSTIFGEIDGEKSERIRLLAKMFNKASIPHSVSKNMDAWQKCHLALVLPLAQGIYLDGGDNFSTANNKEALRFMARTLKQNFKVISSMGIGIMPRQLALLACLPDSILSILLKFIYRTEFAGTVICEHSLGAKGEMEKLGVDFEEMCVLFGKESGSGQGIS